MNFFACSKYLPEDSKLSDEDKEIIFQEKTLLKSINAIGYNGGFYFNNFYETIQNDSLPKFVMHFFCISSIENVHFSNTVSHLKSNNLTNEEIQNIFSVIEFLKTKQNKFKLLLFNFKTRKNAENSAKLFYSNFLNFFFLKTSKKEICQRCKKILGCPDSEDYIIFSTYKQYILLLKFVSEKQSLCTNNKNQEQQTDSNYAQKFFEKAKIPMIINDEILKYDFKPVILTRKRYKLSIYVYYQLQFILDVVNSTPSLLIKEFLLNAYHKLFDVSVPSLNRLNSIIKNKMDYLNLQKERIDVYLNRNEISIEKQSNIHSQSKKQNQTLSNYQTNDKNQSLKTFNENENNSIIQKNDAFIEKFESFTEFWNISEPDIVFENGLIYDRNKFQKNYKKSQKDWVNEMNEIADEIQKSKMKESLPNCQIINQCTKSKLYRIFHFDENDNKWYFDHEIFNQMLKDQDFDLYKDKTSLILLFNSYKNDLNDIISILSGNQYSKFEENEMNQNSIFIFALCNQLQLKINDQNQIKSIFLFLHLPKNEEKLNILNIIVEIYAFLYIVCDIGVTILNMEHYLNQIEFVKSIISINKVFNKKLKETKSETSCNMTYLFRLYSNFSQISRVKNEEEEEEEEEEKWENINEDNYYISNENDNLIKKDDLTIFTYKKTKMIFLVNNEKIDYDKNADEYVKNKNIYMNIKSQIDDECLLHYLNLKNPNTYNSFINSIISEKCNNLSTIKSNFSFIKVFHLSKMYIILKSKIEYQEELKKIIYKRYSEFKSIKKQNDDPMTILSKIQKEISVISPIHDQDFLNECNLILSQIKNEEFTIDKDYVKNELKIRAESHLMKIKHLLNQKYIWTSKEMQFIISSHNRLLEEEFLNIIKKNCFFNSYEFAYESYYSICEDQIKEDKELIKNYAKSYLNQLNIKNNANIKDPIECINKETNYTMKETENLKEIKVEIQIDKDLKTEIEQDF